MGTLLKMPTRSRITAILQQLIRMRTHQPYGNEKDVVKYIISLFPDDSVEKRIIDHGNNRATLIITIPGEDHSKSRVITGHIDTVGVDYFEEWQHPPFAADIEGDLLYGRGAADMKGGLTSMLSAALFYVESAQKPPVDIHFCFTADEEVNGTGAKSIIRGGFLKNAEEMVVIKPTDQKIGLAEKGAIWLNIEIKGKKSHASMPELGINAIEEFNSLVEEVRTLLQRDKKHPLLGSSSCVITSLCAEGDANIIPDSASGTLDIRTLPSIDHDVFLNTLDSLVEDKLKKAHPCLNISLQVTNNRPPVGMSKKSPLIMNFCDIYRELGFPVEYTYIPYFTDASIFIPSLGIPFVFLGPGSSQFFDQSDEYVSLTSVLDVAKILINYIAGGNRINS